MDARDAQYQRDALDTARPPDEHETRDPRDAPETTVLVPGIIIVLMPSIYYYISLTSKKQKGGPRPAPTILGRRSEIAATTRDCHSQVSNRQSSMN